MGGDQIFCKKHWDAFDTASHMIQQMLAKNCNSQFLKLAMSPDVRSAC